MVFLARSSSAGLGPTMPRQKRCREEDAGLLSQDMLGGNGRTLRGIFLLLERSLEKLLLRPERPFTGVSGPEIPKSLKKSLVGGLQQSRRKYPKKLKNAPKCPIWGIFAFFGYFRGLFVQTLKKTLFLRLFGISGPESPETPVNGRSGRKMTQKHLF